MGRRYKSEGGLEALFNEIVGVSQMLPIWITISLALYLLIFIPTPTPNLISASSPSIIGFFHYSILVLLKFFAPLALVCGAIINVGNRIKSHFMFDEIKRKGAYELLERISWQDFEFLLFEVFKKQGFSAELTGGGGADGGVDIRLRKGVELHLVQCKHWKSAKVSVMVVRELYGIMSAQGAVGGVVVTSGKFTAEAYEFAKNLPIDLVDRRKLLEILNQMNLSLPELTQNSSIICPKCGLELVEKTGKFGKFMGCSTYPKCSYTNSL